MTTSITSIKIRTAPTVTALFRTIDTEAGVPADPAIVTFVHVDGEGNATTYVSGQDSEVENVAVGEWTFKAPAVTVPGTHVIGCYGSGDSTIRESSEEVTFYVPKSLIP